MKNDECVHYCCECVSEILKIFVQEKNLYKEALEQYAKRKQHRIATEALIDGRNLWAKYECETEHGPPQA